MDQVSRALLAAGGGAAEQTYVEDVFSTYLYTGSPSNNTITNGIDLAGKGGLVWMKSRTNYTTSGYNHALYDTERGNLSRLLSNTDGAATTGAGGTYMQSFNNNGFTLVGNGFLENYSPQMVSWTFRKQPKFFDVVTYTGNGSTDQVVNHSLGTVPGVIIVKAFSGMSENAGWLVYHRSLGYTTRLVLNNSNAAQVTDAGTGYAWGTTGEPTATTFTVGDNFGNPSSSQSGITYVAYLFAHDAGGFGASGTDNVISCGSFTTDGSGNATVTLGYEPQWVLYKPTSGNYNWFIVDSMRKMAASGFGNRLFANLDAAEDDAYGGIAPNATGFNGTALGGYGLAANTTYIYIAIRRPNKPPTTGTSVFAPIAYSGAGTIQLLTTNFPVDAYIQTSRQAGTTNRRFGSRLTGLEKYMLTDLTAVEQTLGSSNGVNNTVGFASNTGIGVQGDWNNPSSPAYSPYIMWSFRRAPGFFDVVCYTSTGVLNRNLPHNLGVTPELVIAKCRSVSWDWFGWCGGSNILGGSAQRGLSFNSDAARRDTSGPVHTSTTISTRNVQTYLGKDMDAFSEVTLQNQPFIAYLFATVPGVSKVGGYTGNGSSQTINCGFTGGARFVLIKRSNGIGDWYVWDTARGIISANDPHLSLNSTAAEVTTNDSIDPDNTGFIVNQVVATNINVTSATYIFLAIA